MFYNMLMDNDGNNHNQIYSKIQFLLLDFLICRSKDKDTFVTIKKSKHRKTLISTRNGNVHSLIN